MLSHSDNNTSTGKFMKFVFQYSFLNFVLLTCMVTLLITFVSMSHLFHCDFAWTPEDSSVDRYSLSLLKIKWPCPAAEIISTFVRRDGYARPNLLHRDSFSLSLYLAQCSARMWLHLSLPRTWVPEGLKSCHLFILSAWHAAYTRCSMYVCWTHRRMCTSLAGILSYLRG